MTKLRRWWWKHVRRYTYEICDDCGRPVGGRAFGFTREDGWLTPVTYWFADNPLWNTVMGGSGGVLCPQCFTARAGEQGIAVGWRAGIVGDIEKSAPKGPKQIAEYMDILALTSDKNRTWRDLFIEVRHSLKEDERNG